MDQAKASGQSMAMDAPSTTVPAQGHPKIGIFPGASKVSSAIIMITFAGSVLLVGATHPDLVSIATLTVQFVAFAVAIEVYRRWRDWRVLPLSAIFLLMALCKGFLLLVRAEHIPMTPLYSQLQNRADLLGTLLAFAFATYLWRVFALERIVGQTRQTLVETEQVLNTHVRFEEGLATASAELLPGVEPQDALEGTVHKLLAATDASRVCIFQNVQEQNHGLCMRPLHEACAAGVTPVMKKEALWPLPYINGLERWQEKLQGGESIKGTGAGIPAGEREKLQLPAKVSILVLPIRSGMRWHGFLRLDRIEDKGEWLDDENRLMGVATAMIGAYLERREVEEELRRHRHHLDDLVAQRTQELGAANARLRREIIERKCAEETQRALLNATTDTAALLDSNGTVVAANAVVAEICGQEAEQLTGRNFFELCSEAAIPIAVEQFEEVLRTRNIVRFTAGDADGRQTFSVNLYPVLDERGELTRVAVFAQDITERRRLQEQLYQSEKMMAIGELAGGIAHDFNNQLTSIMAYADMLRDELQGQNTLQRYADMIVRAAERASGLPNQLLAFARKGKYQSVTVNCHALLTEVVNLLQHSIDKRIRIQQEFHTEELLSTGDPTQLQNAFLNIALNARDAMPEGGDLTIRTQIVTVARGEHHGDAPAMAPGRYALIQFIDNGIGMDEETRKHIFEPFFTTKAASQGTGMGLAATYGTISNHKGAIDVVSEPGRGTTVAVYLPMTDATSEPDETRETAVPAHGPARLLLVDDEESVLRSVGDMLDSLGYSVTACRNGVEAINIYRKSWRDFDLVILDLVMPELSGQDTLQALQAINPGVKALLASGYTHDDKPQEIVPSETVFFIQKPFRKQTVCKKILLALQK